MATHERDTGWSRVLSGGSAILIINPTYMKNILVCDDIVITNAAMLTFFNFCIVMDVWYYTYPSYFIATGILFAS